MYVNAWLEQEPWIPGTYPSGGPQFKNYAIWKQAAPSSDLYAPDVYVENFREICEEYTACQNPLFIPETRLEPAFYLYSVGAHQAMCYSPFGIEDSLKDVSELDEQMLAQLNISADAMGKQKEKALALAKAYQIIGEMDPMICKAGADHKCHGFLSQNTENETVSLSHVDLLITYAGFENGWVGGGLVIELDAYEFLVMAVNCSIRFADRSGRFLDTLVKEEGSYENGAWNRCRILNGDERYTDRFREEIRMIRYKLYPYDA